VNVCVCFFLSERLLDRFGSLTLCEIPACLSPSIDRSLLLVINESSRAHTGHTGCTDSDTAVAVAGDGVRVVVLDPSSVVCVC